MSNFAIQTWSGVHFDVFNPDPKIINIEDISHALSNKCRYGGHSNVFFSVAQHSIECLGLLKSEHRSDYELQLSVLLHDATEAYLPDVPTPIKRNWPEFKKLEASVENAIAEKFNIDFNKYRQQIKELDSLSLEIEWKKLMLKNSKALKYVAMSPTEAKKRFLFEFDYLLSKKLYNSSLII